MKIVTSSVDDRRREEEERKGEGGRKKADVGRISNTRSRRRYVTELSIVLIF